MYLQRLLDMHMMRANQQVQFIRYRQYKNMKEEKVKESNIIIIIQC